MSILDPSLFTVQLHNDKVQLNNESFSIDCFIIKLSKMVGNSTSYSYPLNDLE